MSSDGDVRARRRGVLLEFVAPRRISAVEETIAAHAEAVVDRLLRRDSFDAVADFASALPVGVVAEVRADESLVAPMVAEAVRLSSPIRGFTRRVAVDTQIDGQPVPAGSRAVLLFASANHDEREFSRPEEVDLARPVNQQLGWGHGRHACVGTHLAKLEMRALLDAMRPRVEQIRTESAAADLRNNTRQGPASLPVSFC